MNCLGNLMVNNQKPAKIDVCGIEEQFRRALSHKYDNFNVQAFTNGFEDDFKNRAMYDVDDAPPFQNHFPIMFEQANRMVDAPSFDVDATPAFDSRHNTNGFGQPVYEQEDIKTEKGRMFDTDDAPIFQAKKIDFSVSNVENWLTEHWGKKDKSFDNARMADVDDLLAFHSMADGPFHSSSMRDVDEPLVFKPFEISASKASVDVHDDGFEECDELSHKVIFVEQNYHEKFRPDVIYEVPKVPKTGCQSNNRKPFVRKVGSWEGEMVEPKPKSSRSAQGKKQLWVKLPSGGSKFQDKEWEDLGKDLAGNENDCYFI